MRVKVNFDLEEDGKVYSLDEVGLKEIMDIPDNVEEDEVADWIADTTGWCVNEWIKINIKHFIAIYRWDGRCNAFERRVRVVTADNEKEALELLKKNDPDVKEHDWRIEEIYYESPHVENVLDVDWN